MCGSHGAVGGATGLPVQQASAAGHGHAAGAGGAGALPGHEGHGHNSILYSLADTPPNAGAFIEGSLGGSAGKGFDLAKGKGFKGKAGRDPNGNDQKQNNLKEADANRPAYGIPKQVAGTNEKPNYVMDIQVSIGIGGLEALRPDVLQTLIANQNAGKGSVWNGVAYLTGLINTHDGSVPPELEAQRSQIMQTQVGGSGKTLAQWAENPKDENGTNWARSNHAMTGIKAYLQLEQAGVPSSVANKLANNDDLVSGAGRIDQIAPGRASNNQENTFTGMNDAERKEWAKAADEANKLGRPDILRILMDSHTMGSHMLTQYGNKGAKSKINGNLGLDPNMNADARKAVLVEYFMNNKNDPKNDGDKAKAKADAGNGAAQVGGANHAGGADHAGGATGAPPPSEGPKQAAEGGCGCGGDKGGAKAGGGSAVGGAEGAGKGATEVAGAKGGGASGDLTSILAQLQQLLDKLKTMVGGATGSGPTQVPPVGQLPPVPGQLPPLPTTRPTAAVGVQTLAGGAPGTAAPAPAPAGGATHADAGGHAH